MLKECLSALPPSWQASTIKAVVGGWTTERRVRQINIPCKFGCPSECGTQKHQLSCPLLWGAVQTVWAPSAPSEILLD
eukprot:2537218-Pyramimonas_sp.AAC.1